MMKGGVLMNQIETGKFIAECRKEKKLTQAQLAEKLNITDRAVSKWETGKSMPDSSIMLELCSLLNISVNELLTGGKIDMSDVDKYKENAENNLISLLHNRKKLFVIRLIGWVLIVCGILTFPAILNLNVIQEIIMRAMGILIFVCGNIVIYFYYKYQKAD